MVIILKLLNCILKWVNCMVYELWSINVTKDELQKEWSQLGCHSKSQIALKVSKSSTSVSVLTSLWTSNKVAQEPNTSYDPLSNPDPLHPLTNNALTQMPTPYQQPHTETQGSSTAQHTRCVRVLSEITLIRIPALSLTDFLVSWLHSSESQLTPTGQRHNYSFIIKS
jgi:hypothetical protein